MTLLLEIIIILVIITGLLYFFFDIKDIVIKIMALIVVAGLLSAAGFFIGIGIQLTNLVFGWN
jgi:hypothetical protein